MHNRLLITVTASPGATSSIDVRRDVYERLLTDSSFCGESGLFVTPLCDCFVIGGLFSGFLAESALGESYKDALRTRLPDLVGHSYRVDLVQRHSAELDAIWQTHGGTGPHPYLRSPDGEFGYPDDAMPVTKALYDALLTKFEGVSTDVLLHRFADLDGELADSDFIGRKWLVVVDYHN